MKFRSIEELPGKWRLQHHEDTDHLAACEQCGKAFVSYSHATIHLYQCHNVKCIQCGQVCDGKCLVDIVMNSFRGWRNCVFSTGQEIRTGCLFGLDFELENKYRIMKSSCDSN